jgi:membrane-associated phospholipid phosphatase
MQGLNWLSSGIRCHLKGKTHWLNAHDEAIARWVSNVLSPPLIASLLAIGFARFVVPNSDVLWGWLLFSLPLISLPPLVYVIWLVRRGELADIHMPQRRSRIKPLGVMTSWLVVCMVLLSRWGAPAALNLFLVGALLQIGILSLVTLFWQISFHSATISAAAATAVAVGGATMWPIAISLLVPLVGWSRVRLRRHTFRQVTAGCVVGTLVALLLILGLWPCLLSAETG